MAKSAFQCTPSIAPDSLSMAPREAARWLQAAKGHLALQGPPSCRCHLRALCCCWGQPARCCLTAVLQAAMQQVCREVLPSWSEAGSAADNLFKTPRVAPYVDARFPGIQTGPASPVAVEDFGEDFFLGGASQSPGLLPHLSEPLALQGCYPSSYMLLSPRPSQTEQQNPELASKLWWDVSRPAPCLPLCPRPASDSQSKVSGALPPMPSLEALRTAHIKLQPLDLLPQPAAPTASLLISDKQHNSQQGTETCDSVLVDMHQRPQDLPSDPGAPLRWACLKCNTRGGYLQHASSCQHHTPALAACLHVSVADSTCTEGLTMRGCVKQWHAVSAMQRHRMMCRAAQASSPPSGGAPSPP